jgi:uncharacterized protein
VHIRLGQTGGVDEPGAEVADTSANSRPRYGLEVIAVLGVSLGMSGVYALLSLIRTEITVPGGIANANVAVVQQANTSYPLLDLADALADVLHGIAPAFLALVLLLRSPGGGLAGGLGVGFRRPRWVDTWQGVGFTALIGLPGLALLWIGHELGFNGTIIAADVPDRWYRIPLLLLDAAQSGALEEIVIVAFLLTRLRQLGWSDQRALATSAVIRGSYHLYQGLGGFFGNMVMGLIFGWWFQRTRRVMPLVIAHFLLDAISFIGYIYLSGRVSWI